MRRRLKSLIPLGALLLCCLTATANSGEFEGTYHVGPTTCTVAPAKMAFELRWARGDGVIMFFFDSDSRFGPYSFVSEPRPDGLDRFIFDDRRLSTGTFIRSDGLRFAVARQTSKEEMPNEARPSAVGFGPDPHH